MKLVASTRRLVKVSAMPPSRRWLRRLFTALGALTLTVLLLAGTLVLSGLRDRLGPAEVALVLGNKVEADGRPSARLQARLDRTVELYRAGCFLHIIVSGGLGGESYDEAEVMAGYLAAQGVPKDAIIQDPLGFTTMESAVNTRQILQRRGWRRVLVVTQYFHVPRARLALRRCGVSPVFSAHARFFEARDLYSIPRELVGIVSYTFRALPTAPTARPVPSSGAR